MSSKKETRNDAIARIRNGEIKDSDLITGDGARPRVRRAAFIQQIQAAILIGQDVTPILAAAREDPSPAVSLSAIRAYQRFSAENRAEIDALGYEPGLPSGMVIEASVS